MPGYFYFIQIASFSIFLSIPKGFSIYLIMFLNYVGGNGRNMISEFTENILYTKSLSNTTFHTST
jgi:hypothetical protein